MGTVYCTISEGLRGLLWSACVIHCPSLSASEASTVFKGEPRIFFNAHLVNKNYELSEIVQKIIENDTKMKEKKIVT